MVGTSNQSVPEMAIETWNHEVGTKAHSMDIIGNMRFCDLTFPPSNVGAVGCSWYFVNEVQYYQYKQSKTFF